MEKEYYVYELKFDTGQIYVGSTGDIKNRLNRHIYDMRSDRHGNMNVQNLYNMNHTFVVTLHRVESRESAFTIEQLFIDRYLSLGICLNISLNAKGGDNLTNNPNRENIIERMKAGTLKWMQSLTPEERKLLFSKPGELNGMYGRTHTDEVRAKIVELHTGNSYRKGFKASDETKAKMSEIASQRLGEKNPFYGKTHSDETKELLANNKRGTKPTNSNKLEIDGVTYLSQADAAKALGISNGLITYRLKSKNPKYSGYRVIK